EYAVVFVEENVYKDLPEDLITRLTKKALPAVIPVPAPNSGDENFSGNRLRKIVERAVGSDILG
ncbi:MAG: V-type ATP synthase subunit F, partial [Candidatus Peregrinibacteria bacterium]|nr:V-type ATP synthase subunit F [Candidatus Peregrinibacteria bacterium]